MKRLNLHKAILLSISALLASSCQYEVLEPESTGYIEIRASLDNWNTKVSLQTTETLDLHARWQGFEYIKMFCEKGSKYYEKTETVQISDVSEDGSSCVIRYEVPDEWISFLGHVSEYHLKCFTSICHPEIIDDTLYFNGSLQRERLSSFIAPVYFFGTVEEGTVDGTFQHFYAYELLHIRNLSDKNISFCLNGFQSSKIWYRDHCCVRADDMTAIPSTEAKWTSSNETFNINAGETEILVSAYIPTGYKILDATMVANIDGRDISSSNTKSSNAEIQAGHAYHMYAEWDGNELKFVDGNQSGGDLLLSSTHVNLPEGTVVSVDILESGDYVAQSSDRNIADASIYGDMLRITGHNEGSCSISVRSRNGDGGLKSHVQVNVTKREIQHVDCVDLGLSVQWAASNIGANDAYDSGMYFSWAETSVKNEYNWANYGHSPSRSYNDMGLYNATDNLSVINPEDDIAHISYGGNWRMPTKSELDELKNNCDWQKDCDDDGKLHGYTIVSKINGKKIYIPVSGYMDNSELKDENSAHLWTSTRDNNSYSHKARALNDPCYYSYYGYYGFDRCLGLPVRAVMDNRASSAVSKETYVELGLSVKWASYNVGAYSCEDVGERYAWGSIEPSVSYDWEHYRFSPDGKYSNQNKYNSSDDLRYLNREDDVAYQKMSSGVGAFSRIPTKEEWDELKNNCTWEERTINAVRGYLITSKTNGNSIFLPSAGFVDGTQLKDGMRPRYWSQSRDNNSYSHKSRALNDPCYYSYYGYYGDDRCLGMPIRAVLDETAIKVKIFTGDLVDLGLSVKWASCNVGTKSYYETGNYYAWGETQTKESFTWENYKYCNGSYNTIFKYNSADDLRLIEREDDVVFQEHKSYWRIPEKKHWDELWKNCDRTEIRIAGRRGLLLTSKINGNCIFLPISGYIDGTQLKDGMRTRYWSSTRDNNSYSHKSRALNDPCYYSYYGYYGDDRCLGMPVRPIFEEVEDDICNEDKVELGLSVEWASCNIGAELPEETGYYYAWGEIEPKESYSWDNYKLSNNGAYNGISKYSSTDGMRYLEYSYDVVHKMKQGSWRMPTKAEWDELKSKCEWTEIVRNGRRGYKITGPNGNSIFLPNAGYIDGTQRKDTMRPRYWAIDRDNDSYPHKARALNDPCYYSYYGYYGDDRCLGMPVRGVYDDSAECVVSSGVVDLGLSVDWAAMNVGVNAPELCGSYYAWGETSGKSSYSWDNYVYTPDGKYTNQIKYNGEDKIYELESEDDPCGPGLRMPTKKEWDELKNGCVWTFKIKNGRIGYVISSKTNDNSIFLPICGYKDGSQIKSGMSPHYWSSTRDNDSYSHKARALNDPCYYSYYGYYGEDRCLGMPVRPVAD